MAINFRAADGLNETPVSQAAPLPVTLAQTSAVYGASSAEVSTAGTGWAPSDTVTVSGTHNAQATVLAVTHTKVVSATVVAAGTSGTEGAVTITGTTGTGTKFQATGTIGADGALEDGLVVTVVGDYTANPSDITAEPVTGGNLSDATVALEMGIKTATIETAGVLAETPASADQTDTSGDGTGASFVLTGAVLPSSQATLEAILAILGDADDSAGDNTLIGQLKQIAANTAA